jgi:hypothetical protein
MKIQNLNALRKRILIIIPLFIFSLFTLNVQAQIIQENFDFNEDVKSTYNIEYFTFAEANNTLYFKFLILENSDNAAYTLEYSENGVDFEFIQTKEGFKSPNNTPLLYCYSVNLSSLNAKSYRVKRTSTNEANEYSSIIYRSNNIQPSLSAQLEN